MISFVEAFRVGSRVCGIAVFAFACLTWPGMARAQDEERIVTYEEILADPDNIELTVLYARQRIDAGELQKAAVSLERVLLLNPDLDQARLLYAIVLYRIANFTEAQAELETLKERDLAPTESDLVDQYLARIAERARPWSAFLTFGLGAHYDTNRNYHPSSGEVVVLDTVFTATGEEEDDFGFLAFMSGEYAHKLSPVEPAEVFVRGALVGDEQIREDRLDLLGVFAGIGGRTTVETIDLEALADVTVIGLGDEHFLDVYKGALRASRSYNVDGLPVKPFAEIGAGYEDFDPTKDATFANEEDGPFAFAAVGVSADFTPRAQGSLKLGLRRKDADQDFNSFWRYDVAATAAFVLSDDLLLRGFSSAAIEDYSEPDPFISATTERRDYDFRVGFDFVQRLDPLWEMLGVEMNGNPIAGIAATVGASYEVSDSNLRNFDYDNFRVRALISKRVNF